MSKAIRIAATVAAAMIVVGCAVVPTAPYTPALPGSRSTAQQFADDDAGCRSQAQAWFGARNADNVNQAAAANMAAGALLGAAIGALLGAPFGDAGVGAAIGAGTGLFGGSVVAADMSGYSNSQMQVQYDRIYLHCMYAAGHRVPSAFLAQRNQRYPVPSTQAPHGGYPPANAPPPAGAFRPPSTAAPPGGFPPADTPPPPASRG